MHGAGLRALAETAEYLAKYCYLSISNLKINLRTFCIHEFDARILTKTIENFWQIGGGFTLGINVEQNLCKMLVSRRRSIECE